MLSNSTQKELLLEYTELYLKDQSDENDERLEELAYKLKDTGYPVYTKSIRGMSHNVDHSRLDELCKNAFSSCNLIIDSEYSYIYYEATEECAQAVLLFLTNVGGACQFHIIESAYPKVKYAETPEKCKQLRKTLLKGVTS